MDMFEQRIDAGPHIGAALGDAGTEAAEIARLSAEYDRLFFLNSGRVHPAADEATFSDILTKAGALAEGDLDEARRLIEAAAWFGVGELDCKQFLNVVKKAVKSGATLKLLQEIWDAAAEKARAAFAPTSDEIRRIEAEAARVKEEARLAEISRLEPLAEPIAKDPKLLDRMLKTVAALGVVREESSVLAVYLTATSRLLRRRCLSLLRKGAPASGKNYLIEAVLKLLPAGSVVTFNSSSPTALIYHGAGDENSLQYMIVYLPEASSTLAMKNGVENDFTAMLRQLMSDNRINRQVSVPQRDGPPISVEVIKHGPIVVIVTSARDDVEDELETRMLRADSDESREQTQLVVASIMKDAAGTPLTSPPGEAEIEEWQDFQRWLEASGPYDVVIPFTAAIEAACMLPGAVRVRRDISGLLAAVSASVVIHKAQRQTDAKGRLVATLDDYRHAFDAFALGMAALYRPQLSAGVIALVRAIETMIDDERRRIAAETKAFLAKNPNGAVPFELKFDGDVRATHKQLKAALGIASDDAVMSRVGAALTAGAIERINPEAAKSAGARYRVKIGSSDLKMSAGVPVFPLPASVEKLMDDPVKLAEAQAALAKEQAAAGRLADEDVGEEEDPHPF